MFEANTSIALAKHVLRLVKLKNPTRFITETKATRMEHLGHIFVKRPFVVPPHSFKTRNYTQKRRKLSTNYIQSPKLL